MRSIWTPFVFCMASVSLPAIINAEEIVAPTHKEWEIFISCLLFLQMRVVIEILTGTLFYIEVKDDATVADLKKEIGFQEQLPFDRLILLVDGGNERLLMSANECSLHEYGVEDGSHVYLFFETVEDGSSSCHFLLSCQDNNIIWCHSPHLVDLLSQQSEWNSKDSQLITCYCLS